MFYTSNVYYMYVNTVRVPRFCDSLQYRHALLPLSLTVGKAISLLATRALVNSSVILLENGTCPSQGLPYVTEITSFFVWCMRKFKTIQKMSSGPLTLFLCKQF